MLELLSAFSRCVPTRNNSRSLFHGLGETLEFLDSQYDSRAAEQSDERESKSNAWLIAIRCRSSRSPSWEFESLEAGRTGNEIGCFGCRESGRMGNGAGALERCETSWVTLSRTPATPIRRGGRCAVVHGGRAALYRAGSPQSDHCISFSTSLKSPVFCLDKDLTTWSCFMRQRGLID